MSKIYAIANQKDGVGKTTTWVNLAASLVATKKRVLVVDIDPQGHATMGSGIQKENIWLSVYHLLVAGNAVCETIQHSPTGGYSIIAANSELTTAEIELLGLPERQFYLRNALVQDQVIYDYILIDCPPSLNMLTLNALGCIPWRYYSSAVWILFARGYIGVNVRRLIRFKIPFNSNLTIESIVRTMCDSRSTLTIEVSDQLKEYFIDENISSMYSKKCEVGGST